MRYYISEMYIKFRKAVAPNASYQNVSFLLWNKPLIVVGTEIQFYVQSFYIALAFSYLYMLRINIRLIVKSSGESNMNGVERCVKSMQLKDQLILTSIIIYQLI